MWPLKVRGPGRHTFFKATESIRVTMRSYSIYSVEYYELHEAKPFLKVSLVSSLCSLGGNPTMCSVLGRQVAEPAEPPEPWLALKTAPRGDGVPGGQPAVAGAYV